LLATATRDLTFDGQASGRPLCPGRRILELKFGHAMPAVFKQLIREFAPQLSGISKYRLAAQALNLATVAAVARAPEPFAPLRVLTSTC